MKSLHIPLTGKWICDDCGKILNALMGADQCPVFYPATGMKICTQCQHYHIVDRGWTPRRKATK
jgi:hypothetical protein